MRAALSVLCSCVLMVLAAAINPAHAGDRYYGGGGVYYGDGYYHRSRGNAWYSSDCCYRRVVRHVTQVRYVHVAPRRYGWAPYRPWREGYYRPQRPVYVGRPASYTEVYVGPARRFEGYPPASGHRGEPVSKSARLPRSPPSAATLSLSFSCITIVI